LSGRSEFGICRHQSLQPIKSVSLHPKSETHQPLETKNAAQAEEEDQANGIRQATATGKEKFQTIVNQLMREAPAKTLARMIQQEWGDAQNVGEDTLAKQLKRLHTAITNAAFGGILAEEAKRRASVRIKLFHGSTLDCLDTLVELANLQRSRVLAMWEEEQESDSVNPSLNTAIRTSPYPAGLRGTEGLSVSTLVP
jgi:hypothetical protein